MQIQEIIDTLGLAPLPEEGGMHRQTYLSAEALPDGRPVGCAIYYLLSRDAFSHLHLLDADEVYHFYMGDPVELTQISADGTVTKTVLGGDLLAGQVPQLLVPKGVWQGSRLVPGGSFALMGTTMSPAYTQSGYTHGGRALLLEKFPHLGDVIESLTGDAVSR